MKLLVESGGFGNSEQLASRVEFFHQPMQQKETGKTAAFHSYYLIATPLSRVSWRERGHSQTYDTSQTLARLATEPLRSGCRERSVASMVPSAHPSRWTML